MMPTPESRKSADKFALYAILAGIAGLACSACFILLSMAVIGAPRIGTTMTLIQTGYWAAVGMASAGFAMGMSSIRRARDHNTGAILGVGLNGVLLVILMILFLMVF